MIVKDYGIDMKCLMPWSKSGVFTDLDPSLGSGHDTHNPYLEHKFHT